ncbi:membrane protein [Krasilnikovia cinnamomea]|uniref:Membrane protein n=1 Tax=Krasilnikovia cinnamomea TaxID=349313 RepID=A0A4Q7ZFE4_9ACTN|nr:YhjD/YihY/BrkB family envelope integrity protein [Krasilnikovia cinnamomea]RZU49438.1 membrane protein [Krasilnikovia cinnamomea]
MPRVPDRPGPAAAPGPNDPEPTPESARTAESPAPRSTAASGPAAAVGDDWEARVAGILVGLPRRLRPLLTWLAKQWVGRILARIAAGLVRVQIFDRSMTLAAQAFTSIIPVLILMGALIGPGDSSRLMEIAGLPDAARSMFVDAVRQGELGAFGLVGSLLVLVSSTGLARALARAYTAVWGARQAPSGARAAWRWFATVLTLAMFMVGTRLLGWATRDLPLPHLSLALLQFAADCAVATLLPWLVLGSAVRPRLLAAGGLIFALAMIFLRPAGEVFLPIALRSSADRYGTIGVAFAYIGWLYVVSFCLLLTAVLGQVIAEDEGFPGRLVRGERPPATGGPLR